MNQPKNRPDFIDNDLLNEIRSNVDWQATFLALGLSQIDKKSKVNDWWAKSPFNPEEKTPSFHMNADPKGGARWYCHSTGQGGGVLDLVQAIHGGNIYEAGRWVVDHNCSYYGDNTTPKSTASAQAHASEIPSSERKKSPLEGLNKPIRQTLLPSLTEQGTHPQFANRGISSETCEYLGCGYLPAESKSSLRDRIVFQIRGIEDLEAVKLQKVILSHIGRAIEVDPDTPKWNLYGSFKKSLELYNVDLLLLDPEALKQVALTNRLILVEGCFDLAKCIEAGIKNVLGTFGSQVTVAQAEKLQIIIERLGNPKVLIWYDRDKAGAEGQMRALDRLDGLEIKAQGFNWDQNFKSPTRGKLPIPEIISDPAEFSITQLQWLRKENII